jgi:adenosylcobinamide-phosphate synthase
MNWWSAFPVVLTLACILDAIIGDPEWWPHPVRWIGRFTRRTESVLRGVVSTPNGERLAGVVLAVVVVGGTYGAAAAVLQTALSISPPLYLVAAVLVVWSSLAARSLGAEARAVVHALETEGLPSARARLSMIVGRDTAGMTRAEVLRAVSETVSENTSDAVIAPLFFLALGGPPLMIAYKAVNTLDSMVGYRSPRYLHFGWFSARLDDVANYLPARITAVLIVIASMVLGYDWRRSFRVLVRDGRSHASPNSGLPEAAVAGALGVVFGGAAVYGGVVSEKPFMGDGAEPTGATVLGAVRIMICSSLLMAAMLVFISCFFELLPIVIL